MITSVRETGAYVAPFGIRILASMLVTLHQYMIWRVLPRSVGVAPLDGGFRCRLLDARPIAAPEIGLVLSDRQRDPRDVVVDHLVDPEDHRADLHLVVHVRRPAEALPHEPAEGGVVGRIELDAVELPEIRYGRRALQRELAVEHESLVLQVAAAEDVVDERPRL